MRRTLRAWWLHRRLMWLKFREDYRLVTMGRVGRAANQVANYGPVRDENGGPRAIHWLAIDALLTELRNR